MPGALRRIIRSAAGCAFAMLVVSLSAISWRDAEVASAGAILSATALLVLIVGGGVLLIRRARQP